jgi:hypothetical protein
VSVSKRRAKRIQRRLWVAELRAKWDAILGREEEK